MTPEQSGTSRVLNESEANGLKLVDLMDSDEEDVQGFRDLVEQARGKLQILVHPFYEEEENIWTSSKSWEWGLFSNKEALESSRSQYKAARNKFIATCVRNHIPLLIFEELGEVINLPQRLPSSAKGVVYYVSTEPDRATPRDGSYKSVANKLKTNGVTKICVGGQNMIFEVVADLNGSHDRAVELRMLARHQEKSGVPSRWIDMNIVPRRCPGSLAKKMHLEGIETTLSSISFPERFSTHRQPA